MSENLKEKIQYKINDDGDTVMTDGHNFLIIGDETVINKSDEEKEKLVMQVLDDFKKDPAMKSEYDYWNSVLKLSLKEAEDDDLSDDELDALDAEEEKEFRQKLADRRARVADKRKEKEEKQAKIEALLKEIDDDWSIEHLLNVLTPDFGKCDTLAGELVRAVTNVDGDYPFYMGDGLDDNGPYIAFIHSYMSDEDFDENKEAFDIVKMIEDCAESIKEDAQYSEFLRELEKAIAEYIKNHQELLGVANEDDSAHKINARDYWEDLGMIPEFEIEDCSLPRDLVEYIELGVIDTDDVRFYIQDIIMGLENSTQDVDVFDDYCDVHGLSKNDYDALGGESAHELYDYLEDYARDIENDYGTPDEIRDRESEDEEEETDESLKESKGLAVKDVKPGQSFKPLKDLFYCDITEEGMFEDDEELVKEFTDNGFKLEGTSLIIPAETVIKFAVSQSVDSYEIGDYAFDVGEWSEEAENTPVEIISIDESVKEPDEGPEHGYASVEDYERAQKILDEMSALRKAEAEEGDKLLRAWAVEKTMSDEEFHEKSEKLHKETQEKVEALFKELTGLTDKAKKNESLTEDVQMYVYQFPADMTEEDIKTLPGYNLELLGKVNENGSQPGDYLVKGLLKDLKAYCKEYLGYEMHPDYLYKEEDIALEDILDESVARMIYDANQDAKENRNKKVKIIYGNSPKEAKANKPIKITLKQLDDYKNNYSYVEVIEECVKEDYDDYNDLYDLVVEVLDDYGILYGDIVDNGDRINIVGVDEEEWPEVVDAIRAELHLDVLVPEEGHDELDNELVVIKESVDTSKKENYNDSENEVTNMINEAEELSSKEIETKIANIKEKQIPAVEERIAGYKKEQEESKDEKRVHTLDNKISKAEKEIRDLQKRIEELEKKLADKKDAEAEALRKQAEEKTSKIINPGRGHKVKDVPLELTAEEKEAYKDFGEYLKDKVISINIETSPKSEKILRNCLPELKDNQYVVREGTTSGGYPMKFGISAVLHAKDVDTCPEAYRSYFNSKGDITEVSKVFPILKSSFDILEDKIVTHEKEESLKETKDYPGVTKGEMEPTIYNILGWLANHKEAYADFRKYFGGKLVDITIEDIKAWIAEHETLCADYEKFFNDKLCENLHEEVEDRAFLDAYNNGDVYCDITETRDGNRFIIVSSWSDVEKIQKLLNPEFEPKDKYDTTVLDSYCEWGFDDEYAVCSRCGKLIRTAPDSYSWKADFYVDYDNGEIICGDCVRKDPTEYIAWLLENPEERANTILDRKQLLDLGFVAVDEDLESGWYDRNDNPGEILSKAMEEHPDAEFIFNIKGVGQFAVNYELMMRE